MRSEAELLKLAKSGDTDAFAELLTQNQNRVYGLALKMLGNADDAQDASQEAFIKAWNGLRGFEGRSRFSVWLYRLTYNVCVDELRRRKAEAEKLVSIDGDNTALQIPDSAPGPEELTVAAYRRRALREGMQKLSDDHRRVLYLREDAGLSYSEIAAELDVSEGTVKSRIARARKSLFDILRESGTFSDEMRQINGKGELEHE